MQNLSREEQIGLSRAIIQMLASWGADAEDQIQVLALPEGTPLRAMRRYRDGMEPLPATEEVVERIEHVAGIADALRTTFPANPRARIHWMMTPNRKFANQPPIQVIVEGGLSGLIAVRSDLDCVFSWERLATPA
ncbi:MAG TPA: DUF2384 domain-containing protein [Thiotrichales bacterium]|nr:DUF2384 domain-containing protein [Thiotrichales bacterium]